MKYWIETYTGKTFDYENIESNKIDIIDIAHALSMSCRFNGMCSNFYSVGEHSLLVGLEMEKLHPDNRNLILQALLHDATEAYMPDIPKPLKHYWETKFGIVGFEDRIMAHIYNQLGIKVDNINHKEIKKLDNGLLMAERNMFFKDRHLWEFPKDTPVIITAIIGYSPPLIKKKFLDYYFKWINK